MSPAPHARSGVRWERRGFGCVVAAAVAALVALGTAALAQSVPQGLLAPGDVAVTGFSGATTPAQIAPGVHPAHKTFINVDGPSLRIIGLQMMGAPPNGQFVKAPKPITVTASQIGQVFAVALDNDTPPNIFVAASSAYGLPIVVPDADGQSIHARTGSPRASFMLGLWGGAAEGGGPGSIWRIDGVTGVVALFANVTLDGTPNAGPALGGLAFDPESNSLFVADRQTGMIHRFDTKGTELQRYDHGMQGRIAQGMLPVFFREGRRPSIRGNQFDSEQPATWGYAAPERLVFGLAVHRGRLYYAVAAGLQIWSVGLHEDGSIGKDATIEIEVPPGAGPAEISKITFDDQGRMYLAERPAPTGAFDFGSLTPEGIGRVLRYSMVESQPGMPRVWQQLPDEYAVGLPIEHRNANGGVAIGYDYDWQGRIDRGSCGSFLWSTGEQLRRASNGKLQIPVSLSAPHEVDGLQGNVLWLVRPLNVPPLRTYFIDYDDRFEEHATHGHMGDIAIWRICGPVLRGGWMPPRWMAGWMWWGAGARQSLPGSPPVLDCPADQRSPAFQCCPKGSSPDAGGQCKPWCPNGAMDAKSQQLCGLGFNQATYNPSNLGALRCLDGSTPGGNQGLLGCIQSSPVFNASICQVGWSKQSVPNVGTICMPTPAQLQCGPGQQVSSIDNKCHTICLGTAWPSTQCCPPGSVMSGTGKCCPPGSTPDLKTGQCTPQLSSCPPGQLGSDGACCKPGWSPNAVAGGCCPPGQAASSGGVCQPVACATPNKLIAGKCCSPSEFGPGGICATFACGPGMAPVGANNFCCANDKVYTAAGGVQACCTGNLVNGKCLSQTAGGDGTTPGSGGSGGSTPGGGPGGGTSSGEGKTPGGEGGTPGSPGDTADGTPGLAPCSAGFSSTADGSCCQTGQMTSTGICCPAGVKPTGPNNAYCYTASGGTDTSGGSKGGGTTGGQCCAPGLIPVSGGSCCAASQVTSAGMCCPAGQVPNPKNRLTCTVVKLCGPREALINGACCSMSKTYKDASGGQQCCGQDLDAAGQCPVGGTPALLQQCFAGYTAMPDGSCCANQLVGRGGTTCLTPQQVHVPPPGPPPPRQDPKPVPPVIGTPALPSGDKVRPPPIIEKSTPKKLGTPSTAGTPALPEGEKKKARPQIVDKLKPKTKPPSPETGTPAFPKGEKKKRPAKIDRPMPIVKLKAAPAKQAGMLGTARPPAFKANRPPIGRPPQLNRRLPGR